jgi:hypothetical protein
VRAPAGSYLITGRPRSRTAWLSALMFGRMPCYHDNLTHLDELVAKGEPFGFASPSLAVTQPHRALSLFEDAPIVVIERGADECWPALERWAGFPIPGWPELEDRWQWFMSHVPRDRLLTIDVRMLDRFETANRIHWHCLKMPLCHDRFRAFNVLRIEQHRDKAAQNANISPGDWNGVDSSFGRTRG